MIDTERLHVRLAEKKDFAKIHELKNEIEVSLWEGHFFSLPYEKMEKIYLENMFNDNRKNLVIVEKESGEIVGEASLDINWQHRCAEVGITIAKSKWGKGMASETLKGINKHVFRIMGLNRIQAWILSANAASLKAFRNAGFVQEGVFHKARMHKGEFTDVVWVAIVAAGYAGGRE